MVIWKRGTNTGVEWRKCMLCERDRGTLKHWIEDCDKIEEVSMTMGKILHEKGKVEVVEEIGKEEEGKESEERWGGSGRIIIYRK